jgi:hypothetical protein
LCVTGDAPARVTAILGLLRAAADEIVVVVPAAVSDEACDAYGAAADRVVRVPPDLRGMRLAWAYSLCRADWIMSIAGDELPSRALLDVLPNLLARRDVLQYHIPRRSVYPVPDRWLDSPPWSFEYRISIARNDQATLRFAGRSSDSPEPVLPARYLEEPIYYIGLLGNGLDGPFDTAPIPEGERLAINLVLSSGPKAPPTLEDDCVVESETPSLPDTAYDAELEPLRPRLTALAGEEIDVPVRVFNRGNAVWPWGDVEPRIRLSYRSSAGIEGPRTLFSADVHPGESTVLPLRFVAPSVPGRYDIDVDLVHELVRWFGCDVRFEVEVVAHESEPPAAHARGRIVCVTGMMRSGTSLLARVLNLLGVDFGPGVNEEEVRRAATLANEKGFWENGAIERLNNELLAALGGSALAPPAVPDGWEQRPELKPLREQAARIIARELPGSGAVGWKDPVTSLTLPFWRRVAPIAATVLCLRDPLEVARSLAAVQGTDEETGARLWLAYVIGAFRADPARLIVRYDDFFEDHEGAARRITAFLALPEPAPSTLEDIRSFIEWRLRHHRLAATGGQVSSESMALARSLYRVLATAPGEAGPLVELLHRQMLAAPRA